MSATSSTDDLRNGPVEGIDRLLSDFFKSQMIHPWPAAPEVAASEPSVLMATRTVTADAPRNQPLANRDTGRRARYTLAASVALLLGTGWFLTDGFQPGERPRSNPGVAPHGLGSGGAAGESEVLKKIREEKAKSGDGFVIPKGDGSKIELP